MQFDVEDACIITDASKRWLSEIFKKYMVSFDLKFRGMSKHSIALSMSL